MSTNSLLNEQHQDNIILNIDDQSDLFDNQYIYLDDENISICSRICRYCDRCMDKCCQIFLCGFIILLIVCAILIMIISILPNSKTN
jgi:hypothetical protein